MNLSSLLTLIEDTDQVVEEQLSQYYLRDVSFDKVLEFESVQDKISESRLNFYQNLRRSIKINWFNENLELIIENPFSEQLHTVENILLAMNGFMPTLHSVNKSKNELTSLISEIRDSTFSLNDTTDKLLQINQILFYNHQFGGNNKAYYDIGNSDLSHVIETKRGIPISLSMLTYLICRQINIPCVPANIPRHFMIYFPSEQPYYMDCFNSGNLLSPDDLKDFLNYLHIEKPIESYHEFNFLVVLKRWFQNMSYIYSNQNDDESLMKIQPYIDRINQQITFSADE